jgi:Spy/CpxP family protein refolding chaperone
MRVAISTLLVLALAAPAVAGAGQHGPGRGPGFGAEPGAGFEGFVERRGERLAEALDLTAEQRAAFDQMRADGVAAAQPRLAEMRQLGGELRALLDAGSDDAAAVGAKVLAIHRLRGELRAERERFESEFAKLLDDQQRFAWQAMRENRPGRGPGRHDGFGRRLGPPPAD